MAMSSLMLIVNKLSVYWLPAPSTVLLSQLLASALAMWVIGTLGWVKLEPLRMETMRKFYLVPVAFLGTVYANIKVLQYAPADTFIVFRASTPLVIAILDYMFLGRELPSGRSWVALLLLLLGASGYVYYDKFFRVDAYMWVVAWYAVFCFDQIYIKHAITHVKMSTWTQVYYTNAMAALPLSVVLVASGELSTLLYFEWSFPSVFWMSTSAVMGVAIAYFSFLARASVSATSFTVLGNVCKVLTVFINMAIWDLHATSEGLFCLFVCLFGAYIYKQAPLRQQAKPKTQDSVAGSGGSGAAPPGAASGDGGMGKAEP